MLPLFCLLIYICTFHSAFVALHYIVFKVHFQMSNYFMTSELLDYIAYANNPLSLDYIAYANNLLSLDYIAYANNPWWR